jgi:hypothetical protein
MVRKVAVYSSSQANPNKRINYGNSTRNRSRIRNLDLDKQDQIRRRQQL